MKVAVYSTKKFERSFIEKANDGKHELIYLDKPLSTNTCNLAEGCEAASIFTNDDASSEVLEKLAKLNIKAIATRAAGYDNIDIQKAKQLSIQVANVPEYSPYSIAEHTIAMIQALNRKIVLADKKVKDYNFCLDELVGYDLNGKTVGIIGLGKIGGILAKILHGFGCQVLGYDIQTNKDYEEKYKVQYVTLEDLCKQSDIISLHAPLNEHTKYNNFFSSIVILTLLFSLNISSNKIFDGDYTDGTIDQLILAGIGGDVIIISKILSYWIISSIPTISIIPFFGILYSSEINYVFSLMIVSLFFTIALSIIIC
ncbi:hypothetical protein EON78_07640, partial [bacterium]